MQTRRTVCSFGILVIVATVAFLPNWAFAHCDGMDGPVVKAAQNALETGNVNLVLIWVQKNDESQIRNAFQKTLAVRKLNPQVKELAEMYFFETLVRIHRAGEGAPYMGLQPAGRDVGPAISTADKALENGKVDPLLKLLTEAMQTGVRERFKQVAAKKRFGKDNVSAGREHVKGYVEFVHYVERIYEAAKNPAEGHYPDSQGAAAHKE
jgi:hypothetical protein